MWSKFRTKRKELAAAKDSGAIQAKIHEAETLREEARARLAALGGGKPNILTATDAELDKHDVDKAAAEREIKDWSEAIDALTKSHAAALEAEKRFRAEAARERARADHNDAAGLWAIYKQLAIEMVKVLRRFREIHAQWREAKALCRDAGVPFDVPMISAYGQSQNGTARMIPDHVVLPDPDHTAGDLWGPGAAIVNLTGSRGETPPHGESAAAAE